MITVAKARASAVVQIRLDRLNTRCVQCMNRKSVFDCDDSCRENTANNRRILEDRIKEIRA